MEKITAMDQKKPKSRKIYPILGAGVATIIILTVISALYFATLAKKTVEKVAEKALGVEVSISTLEIDFRAKSVVVSGLNIGNPPGFKTAVPALQFPTIRIAADSLTRDHLILDEITVTGTVINLEVTENTTNLTALYDKLRSRDPAKAQKKPQVTIRKLNIEKALLQPTALGQPLDPVTMPDISITDIGQGQNGVPAQQAMAQVAAHLIKVSINAAAKNGFLQSLGTENLQQIQESLGLPKNFMDQVKKDLNLLGEGLKDLMNR